ncbi:hypothetical protein ACUV84_040178 [Puccinellia chinampoensis]
MEAASLPQPVAVTAYGPSAKDLLLVDTAAGLQAAVLRAQPLSGAHLRSARAQAEKDLAVAEGAEGGDPAGTRVRRDRAARPRADRRGGARGRMRRG